jgi:hypothetical protein
MLALMVPVAAVSQSSPPVNSFVEYTSNPLFGTVTNHAYQPYVIKIGGVYKMWYGDGTNARYTYSTYPDFHDAPFPGTIVTGTTASEPYKFTVYYNPNGWTLVETHYSQRLVAYYTDETDNWTSNPKVAVSDSDDGINWTYVGQTNGVITGPSGMGQVTTVYRLSVLYEGPGNWKGYGDQGQAWIQYYTSSDGMNWTIQAPDILHRTNPSLLQSWEIGPGPQYPGAISPYVFKVNNTYVMAYSGGQTNNNQAIGIAYSGDGENFTKSSINPIFSINDGIAWRSARTYNSYIMFDNGLWRMYFQGNSAPGAYSVGMATSQPAPATVNLGTAGNFRVLAGTSATIGLGTTVSGDVGCTTVTNNGTVNGDVWVTTLDGSGTQTAIEPFGTTVSTAKNDLADAYSDAAGRTAGATTVTGDLGGQTLSPGLYNSASSLGITGNLTLDAHNDSDAVFIFQGNTLTTEANSRVLLINGARWSNVFWQVGSSATLGANSVFEGNILAHTSIDAGDGATIKGRMLAETGEVTLGAGDNSLPVQATSFKAIANDGSITLSWQTQSEVNNAGFNVLRQDLPQGQAGTTSFRLISSYTNNDSLKGMGTSSTGRAYDFTDDKVTSGVTYQYKIQSVSTNGTTKDLTTLSVTVDIPKNYALYQNYPNPFNPSTTIQFDLKQASTVTLGIYNILGQKVLEENYGTMNAGRYNEAINLDAFASGVYFYRITAIGNSAQGGSASGGDGQQFVSIKKLVLMK